MQLGQLGRLRELPRERVLATARTNDEDSHRLSLGRPHAAVSVAGVDKTTVEQWLARYVEAWQTYDPRAIGALFSEDAVYRYHPWDEDEKTVRGRDAIVASWLEERDPPGSWTAEYAPWATDGERVVAVGVSRYLTEDRTAIEREYHNVFLLQFDAENRCREFTELFMRRSD